MNTHKVVRHTESAAHGTTVGSKSSRIIEIDSQAKCWAMYHRLEEERAAAAQGTSLDAALQRATWYTVEEVKPGDQVDQTPRQ